MREALVESARRRLRAQGRGRLPRLTLDVDSLPVEVHGSQPGFQYHGYYKARIYHPLVALAAETGEILDVRLREGAVHTADGALQFILPAWPACCRQAAWWWRALWGELVALRPMAP